MDILHGYSPSNWFLALGVMGLNKRAENLYGLPARLNGLKHASGSCPQIIPRVYTTEPTRVMRTLTRLVTNHQVCILGIAGYVLLFT